MVGVPKTHIFLFYISSYVKIGVSLHSGYLQSHKHGNCVTKQSHFLSQCEQFQGQKLGLRLKMLGHTLNSMCTFTVTALQDGLLQAGDYYAGSLVRSEDCRQLQPVCDSRFQCSCISRCCASFAEWSQWPGDLLLLILPPPVNVLPSLKLCFQNHTRILTRTWRCVVLENTRE